ncbi:MAG TPA: hypothetical protein PKL77_08850 [Candidatus Omnitrophota bacterium]|nr:hypothetical protein [Candidatus Omnitrophota bacterium]
MDKKKNYDELKKVIEAIGFTFFGVADIAGVKQEFKLSEALLKRFDTALVLGMRLSGSILEEAQTQPTPLYFHHYRTVNVFLDQAALRLTNAIQEKGFSAAAIPASQIVDWVKQTAHLSHKKLAVLAGIGWLGRNNLLVTKQYGSQVRLVTVLTDMPLPIDTPLHDSCGSCRKCIAVCPAGAIKEQQEDFDHMACFEKLKEFQRLKLVAQYICGVCVRACAGRDME